MTVHESSLSACVHSILASRIGNIKKAYELYLRTARLDLDGCAYTLRIAMASHVQRRHNIHARQMGISLVRLMGSCFYVLSLTLVDPDFGKQQLRLMLQGHYMHPNGMVPAYEWNFSDVNPPVLAWSTIFTYRLEKLVNKVEDTEWLSANFMKLL